MSCTYLLPPGSDVPMRDFNPTLHMIHCVYWTDGHHYNPYMSRRVSGLMRRPSDGFVFWQEDALDLGTGDVTKPIHKLIWDADDPEDDVKPIVCIYPKEWENLEYVERATEEDYFQALDSGLASTLERELFIRKKLLHIHNHPVRFGECLQVSSRHYENRNALIDQLSGDDMDELLLIVELYREKRRIDLARELIQHVDIDPEDYLYRKFLKIQELCNQAMSVVSIWEGKIEEPQPVWEHYRGV